MRGFFEIPITFKIGVETFDYEFRNSVLNKNAKFNTVEELKRIFWFTLYNGRNKGTNKKKW